MLIICAAEAAFLVCSFEVSLPITLSSSIDIRSQGYRLDEKLSYEVSNACSRDAHI